MCVTLCAVLVRMTDLVSSNTDNDNDAHLHTDDSNMTQTSPDIVRHHPPSPDIGRQLLPLSAITRRRPTSSAIIRHYRPTSPAIVRHYPPTRQAGPPGLRFPVWPGTGVTQTVGAHLFCTKVLAVKGSRTQPENVGLPF